LSSPRLPLLGLALAAVAGILLADYAAPDPRVVFVIALACLPAAMWRGGTPALLLATAAAFALAHTWQGSNDPDRTLAATLFTEPREVRLTGIVLDEPKESPPGSWRAPLRIEKWTIDGHTAYPPVRVIARWKTDRIPRYGDRWEITGVVSRLAPPRNPGQFDAADWWGRRSVYLEMRASRDTPARRLAREAGSLLQSAAFAARDWMLRTLGLGLENAPALRALIAGVTLGARDTESDQFADAFRQTGTFHLFSVSGLHVGMVALLLWLVLRPLGLSRRRAVLVIIPALFFYALVTGASAPSLRAAVMLAAAFAGFLLDRPVSPANSLAAAALLLLGYDTNQLFSPGFQMSFSIVAAIFLLSPPLQEFFAARLRPDPFLPRRLYNRRQTAAADAGHALASTLGVSTAAWLGSLPLTALVFHIVPLLAIPANLVAVPLAFGILAVSMLALLGGLVSAWLAAVFNNTSWGLAALLVGVVGHTADLPGSYVQLPPAWMQPPARLTVFDLSTGGAQLLRTRDSAWLFDTGPDAGARSIIEPALRAAGIGRPSTIVLTHGDAEHLGGAPRLLDAHPPRRWMTGVLRDRARSRATLHKVLQSRELPKSLVLPGDRFAAGNNTAVTILHPGPSDRARTADDQSLVARVDHGRFRILLMSDSGATAEAALVRRNPAQLRADILVLGRHQEDLFATDEFLAAVQPRIVVLAPCDPFREGSDEPALRARLAATGAALFDQDECGAVTVTFRGDRAEVSGFLPTSAHPAPLRLPPRREK
jgi:ComEC/Rec2-related protein